MNYYINQQLGYYEGDKISFDDIEVPQRPSALHDWNGVEWVESVERKKAAVVAQIAQLEEESGVVRIVREGLLRAAEKLAKYEARDLNLLDPLRTPPYTAEELLATNPGYQKTKAFDDQIRELRKQL